MKTIVNSLLVAFALTLTTFSVSNADNNKPAGQPKKVAAFQSSLYTNLSGKVQIAVQKETGGKVMVRLTDAAGKEVFAKEFSKRQKAARLSLDVSNLPDGNYQVEITNGVDRTTQELMLSTQKPNVATRFVAIH